MSRTITVAAENASLADVVRPLLLIDLDFSSGHIRLNSTPYALTYASNAYQGAAKLGEITPVEETADIQATAIAMKLYAVPRDVVSLALAEQYQGRSATMMLGLMDDNWSLVANPVTVFAGRMDVMSISLGETASVSMTVESRFADWERPRIRRYTSEDQAAFEDAADSFFDYAPTMVEKTVKWGKQ